MGGDSHPLIIVFTLLLGGMIAVVQKSGGNPNPNPNPDPDPDPNPNPNPNPDPEPKPEPDPDPAPDPDPNQERDAMSRLDARLAGLMGDFPSGPVTAPPARNGKSP